MLFRGQNIIVGGHWLCEIGGGFDLVVLLRLNPERLAARLELRGYRDEKVQDNVFCEGIDYCKKHAKRNYSARKIIEIENSKTIKEITVLIVTELFLRSEHSGKLLHMLESKRKVVK